MNFYFSLLLPNAKSAQINSRSKRTRPAAPGPVSGTAWVVATHPLRLGATPQMTADCGRTPLPHHPPEAETPDHRIQPSSRGRGRTHHFSVPLRGPARRLNSCTARTVLKGEKSEFVKTILPESYFFCCMSCIFFERKSEHVKKSYHFLRVTFPTRGTRTGFAARNQLGTSWPLIARYAGGLGSSPWLPLWSARSGTTALHPPPDRRGCKPPDARSTQCPEHKYSPSQSGQCVSNARYAKCRALCNSTLHSNCRERDLRLPSSCAKPSCGGGFRVVLEQHPRHVWGRVWGGGAYGM